jgi:hypothetical protein
MRPWIALALVLTGCNAIFGLEPTSLRTDDGGASAVDAPAGSRPDGGGPGDIDASVPDAGPAPECFTDPDCGTPTPDSCVSYPTCVGGHCMLLPAPRDTFCNGFQDQCDGAGNCVDCTNSGGCGECCVCSGEVCIPA